MTDRIIKCPTCGSEMTRRDRHGVEIDLCLACRGVWLDRSELDTIIERSSRFLEIPDEDGRQGAQNGYRRIDLGAGRDRRG